MAWLPTITSRCTRLEHVTPFPRGTRDWRDQAGRIVSKCVRSWDSIKSLRTDIVDSAAFQYLSRCGELRHLQLCDNPSALPSNENGAAFPALETLYLDGEVKAPTRFLEWADGISIVDFTEECPPWTTADEVHALFSAVPTGISHFSLKHFAFDDHYDSFDAANVHVHLIRSSSLRRLFCFTNLTSVSILSAVGVDMDDTTATDMARSWPHIQRLELQSFYGTPVPPATLQCLQAFAKYCPHLTKLCMSFDATVIPDSHGDLSLESLEHLDVEGSPIRDAACVAPYIKAIFPKLRSIGTLLDSLEGDHELGAGVVPGVVGSHAGWKNVETLLIYDENM
ncbi:hypothetical protein FB45DRAFT_302910 [Roridomyces roridus]|uniref:F-box protein n=1 Tax=Roridomyces roridus TaxID=1738132 RepID=A0AAD7FCZ1_9AGAR|nr:hypothetical protein FB45DRAFT_302910 [Roridomyces roridus]